jgi:hypothetical protein
LADFADVFVVLADFYLWATRRPSHSDEDLLSTHFEASVKRAKAKRFLLIISLCPISFFSFVGFFMTLSVT